jgi:hypothetical protein
VPATTVEAVMMVPVTKSQDQVGPAIVGPVVVAMPIVAPATMDGSAATKMAMPPATMGTPPAASMIAMCFGDKTVFDDGTFTQPAKRRGLCHDGGTQQEATSKEEGYHAVHACSLMLPRRDREQPSVLTKFCQFRMYGTLD